MLQVQCHVIRHTWRGKNDSFFFLPTILSLAPRALANHSPFPTRRRGRRVPRPAGPTLSPRPLVQAEPHRRAGGSVRRAERAVRSPKGFSSSRRRRLAPALSWCWAGVERSGDTIELGSILSWTFSLLVGKASTLLRSD
ncbi:hypothetical protein PVAP13_3KG063054 [Panicum virgatum]|uniref:Uncharacterized protein n=1 Tax=Panicum virgatum TaxID=38727 RepID=A0A8T0UFP8_PANVG|nr:hypothetical protein PVAP13_3KG063054 [Panicum virgatum]